MTKFLKYFSHEALREIGRDTVISGVHNGKKCNLAITFAVYRKAFKKKEVETKFTCKQTKET